MTQRKRQRAAQKALDEARAPGSPWIEISQPNGLLEFRHRDTGDIYRMTTDGEMVRK